MKLQHAKLQNYSKNGYEPQKVKYPKCNANGFFCDIKSLGCIFSENSLLWCLVLYLLGCYIPQKWKSLFLHLLGGD